MRDEKPAPMEIGAGFSSLIGSFAQHSTISYMLYKKLKIKPSQTLLTINAPTGFKETLGELPEGVKISSKASEFQQIHWFVKTKGQMEKELKSIVDRIKPGVICWIYFPKGSSKIQTEKQLKEYGDKIPADKKGAIETAMNKLKEAHKSQDLAAVDASMAELNAAWTAASQDMYNAQQAGAQPGDNPQNGEQSSGTASGDNVTDVPYEEVK